MSLLKHLNQKSIAKGITILSFPFLIAGCFDTNSSDDSSSGNSGGSGDTTTITRGGTIENTVLGNNTVRLESSYIEYYNSDTGEIHLKDNIANQLRGGDIILIPEKGIWKKVDFIQYNSKNKNISKSLLINLTNATIEETFKELNINEIFPIHKTIPVNKVVYDKDGNNLTTNDQVRITGNLFLSGDANFWLEVYNSTLERTGLLNNFELHSDVELNVGKDITKGYISRREFSLPPIILPPIILPAVEITPQINLRPNFEGFFGFEMKDHPRVIYNANVNAEISYTKENGWDTEESFIDNFDMILPTIADKYTYIKAGLSVQLFPKFYHLAGPFLEVEGGMEFNLSTSKNPYWTFGPYLEGRIGVEADLFGFFNTNGLGCCCRRSGSRKKGRQ